MSTQKYCDHPLHVSHFRPILLLCIVPLLTYKKEQGMDGWRWTQDQAGD